MFKRGCHRGGLFAVVFGLLAGTLPLAGPARVSAQVPDAQWTGGKIMAESLRRHQQFPFVYEEQTMILIDREDNREVRRCRRFTRIDADGSVKFLLVFDDPAEIRGVALLATRDAQGRTDRGVYLPAFGAEIKHPTGAGLGERFLGTDFSIEDLTPEPPDDFRYVRQRDRLIDDVEYFVVDAYPKSGPKSRTRNYGLRKHLLRKKSFMVVQTDVYDGNLRFIKRISRHDLKRVGQDSWRANMIVAKDREENHRTLLKIDRRVYSRDYVPPEIFETAYLLANRHVSNPATGVDRLNVSAAEKQLLERGDEP